MIPDMELDGPLDKQWGWYWGQCKNLHKYGPDMKKIMKTMFYSGAAAALLETQKRAEGEKLSVNDLRAVAGDVIAYRKDSTESP